MNTSICKTPRATGMATLARAPTTTARVAPRACVCAAQDKDWRQTAAAVALSAAIAVTGVAGVADAIPQTSECATNACDDRDYSNRDLRKEFFTKGSMKRANFSNSNMKGVTFFGGDVSGANFTNADLTNADLGQCNFTNANLTNAILENAIVSSARFPGAIIDGADFSEVILRKDVNDELCARAKGTNSVTGVDTKESLMCK